MINVKGVSDTTECRPREEPQIERGEHGLVCLTESGALARYHVSGQGLGDSIVTFRD